LKKRRLGLSPKKCSNGTMKRKNHAQQFIKKNPWERNEKKNKWGAGKKKGWRLVGGESFSIGHWRKKTGGKSRKKKRA